MSGAGGGKDAEGTGGVQVRNITVARTARYAVCGAEPAAAERLWVVFHGYGNRAADFIAPFAAAASPNTRVVAPEGLSRFYVSAPVPDGSHLAKTGATWLTRDDREDELRDALAMLHAVVAREHAAILAARPGSAPRVGVLGFSQGVAMSMRWLVSAGENPSLRQARALSASGAPALVAMHVLWAGGLAHDVDNGLLSTAWADTALHVVVGERDAFASEQARASTRQRLQAIGVAATAHSFDGGHRLHSPLLATLLEQL